MGEACASQSDTSLETRVKIVDQLVRDWMSDPEVCLVVGDWIDGTVAEIFPRGKAEMPSPRYEGNFVGVCDLRIANEPHHCHLDLGRIHTFELKVAPSVCFGFEPSLELRLLRTGDGGAHSNRHALALIPSSTYKDGEPDHPSVKRFMERFMLQSQAHPRLFDVDIARDVKDSDLLKTIAGIVGSQPERLVEDLGGVRPQENQEESSPWVLELMAQALELPDASLVIYRERTLVEFKTSELDGIHRYEEAGHVSWQIGGQTSSHCHLDLGSIDRVEFSAQRVSCQKGRLNYTVWFLISGGRVGNPFRRDGYFSIVFNNPYRNGQLNWDCLKAFSELYQRYSHLKTVSADEGWQKAYVEIQAGREPKEM